MGCGGSTQARSPSRRFGDPTPKTQSYPSQQQATVAVYPSAPPQPVQYSQPGYAQPQQGYYQAAPGYGQPVAPQGDPAYPPPAYPPPNYPVQPSAPVPPPVYPVQQQQAVYGAQPTQTTVIVKERKRSNSGSGAMMLVGGLAMGAVVGAALSGSLSSLGSFD